MDGDDLFAFVDLAGRTTHWAEPPDPATFAAANARFQARVGAALAAQGGRVFSPGGEVLAAVFASPAAALAAVRAVLATPDGTLPLRARAALHAGAATEREGVPSGSGVYRGLVLLAAAHAGQALVSPAAAERLRDALPAGVTLRDRGAYRLGDARQPETLYQFGAPGLDERFPRPRTVDQPPNNLPLKAPELIGRKRDAAVLRAWLRNPGTRLVTLVGPGGAGKTRLSVLVAVQLRDEFAAGAFFVPLAPVNNLGLLISTLARAIGAREAPGRTLLDSLLDYLSERELLLVLDNFEQLLDATPFVGTLLERAPWLKLIVTSRAPLNLPGEQVFTVPPLRTPDPRRLPSLERMTQFEAVRLFIVRALAVQPGFVVDNANAPAVAELCARLDGLPLAIELAAAHCRDLTPEQILAQFSGAGPVAALDILQVDYRQRPERQHTLRKAIDWSYALLTEGERSLFARLGVFPGGATTAAIEAVCGRELSSVGGPGVQAHLDALAGKSLLRVQDGRYGMLETIFEYAREKLLARPDAAELLAQHAAYYLALVEAAEPNLRGPDALAWLNQLEAENDNLRAALAWAIDAAQAEIALRTSSALWHYWWLHSRLSEGAQWLKTALDLPQTAQVSAAVHGKALNALGVLRLSQGDLVEGRLWLERGLARRLEAGDRLGLAGSYNNLGIIAQNEGDYAGAADYYAKSLALGRELGVGWSQANALNNLGRVAYHQGEYAQAAQHYAASLELWQAAGAPAGKAIALCNCGFAAQALGDLERAEAFFEQSMALRRELAYDQGIAECLVGLACVDLLRGDPARAAGRCSTADALLAGIGSVFEPLEQAEFERVLAQARAELGEHAYAEAWAHGREG
jgi:predicted ATPase/Tfp pilus assembly protein PilF